MVGAQENRGRSVVGMRAKRAPFLGESLVGLGGAAEISRGVSRWIERRLQVEAKYPALLFKQQLTAFVEKIYGMVRDNVKREITTELGQCIQEYVMHVMRPNQAQRTGDSDTTARKRCKRVAFQSASTCLLARRLPDHLPTLGLASDATMTVACFAARVETPLTASTW
eukprot:7067833-Pyramimonas_sp.AAC.1